MLFALVLSFAGAFALGDALFWYLRGNGVVGTVVGVRSRGGASYWCVYRYRDATGRTIETSSSIATTSGLADKQTGSNKRLRVFADQPGRAREAYICYFEAAAGPSLMAVGLLMGWPHWLVWALGVAAGLVLAKKTFNRTAASVARASGRSSGGVAARQAAALQRAEDILAASGSAERDVRNIGRIGVVSGLVMLATCIYVARPIAQLEMAGMHAPGDVVAMKTRVSAGRHGNTVYYPVVRFTTASGTSVQFTDNQGSDPPPNHVGDKVQVLYLAGTSPVHAIIDRGIGNWLFPVICGLFGSFALALGVRQFSLVRSMQRPLQPASLRMQAAPQPMSFQMQPVLEPTSFQGTETSTDAGVTPAPRVIEGVSVLKQDARSASRIRRLGGCFLIGWVLSIAFIIGLASSPAPYRGAAVLFVAAPILGFFGFLGGQALAVIYAVGRLLIAVTGNAPVQEPATADSDRSATPVPRVLDLMLTAALVLMAGGCVLIGVGLAAQLYRYFSHFPT